MASSKSLKIGLILFEEVGEEIKMEAKRICGNI